MLNKTDSFKLDIQDVDILITKVR